MKTYFKIIKFTQEAFLGVSIFLLMFLPLLIVFRPDVVDASFQAQLYLFAHIALFFVMLIRPLADIFTKTFWIRSLVMLRKGVGVFSASIIISFILAKLMVNPAGYFSNFVTLKYWSMVNYAALAHTADVSAFILIITSNNFSKRILGDYWKTIQRLSYVYLYCSVLYVYLTYKSGYLLFWLGLITVLTAVAFIINRIKASKVAQVTASPVSAPVLNNNQNI